MCSRIIENKDLVIDDLPDISDRRAIFQFAMSFNGYNYYGSFEACAEKAKSKQRNNLTDIRNELFFAARAARHRGDDEFIECYKELLPIIKLLLNDA